MRLERVDDRDRWPRVPPLAVGAGLAWAALIGGLAIASPRGSTPPTCLFRAVTGVTCPTCGGTRATLALVSGDVASAIAWNPLVVAFWIVCGAILVARVVLLRRLSIGAGKWAWPLWVIVTAVLVNWGYVLATQATTP